MKEHFLTYEQSLAVKELGFDEPTIPFFNPSYKEMGNQLLYGEVGDFNNWNKHPHLISAPLKSQFFKWVREKYGYNCFITSSCKDGMWYYFREDLSDRNNDSEPELTPKFDTFEQAEDACINKIIELLKLK